MKKTKFYLIALIVLLLLANTVLAESLTVEIESYPAKAEKDSQIIIPVAVTLSGATGTVDVTITPDKAGFTCDPCTKEASFRTEGTVTIGLPLIATNTGVYNLPFSIKAEKDSNAITENAISPITVKEEGLWELNANVDSQTISNGDDIRLDAQINVLSGTAKDVDVKLVLPPGFSLKTGISPVDLGDITGITTLSWIIIAGGDVKESDVELIVKSAKPAQAQTNAITITCDDCDATENENSDDDTKDSVNNDESAAILSTEEEQVVSYDADTDTAEIRDAPQETTKNEKSSSKETNITAPDEKNGETIIAKIQKLSKVIRGKATAFTQSIQEYVQKQNTPEENVQEQQSQTEEKSLLTAFLIMLGTIMIGITGFGLFKLGKKVF